jgi:hypothetical protein
LIESLDEIPDIIKSVNQKQYNEILENVRKVSENIRNGYYLKRVLLEMYDN